MKIRTSIFFLSLLVIGGGVGCKRPSTVSGISQREVISESSVEIGMSRNDVLKRLGEPSHRIADPGGEVLTFLVDHQSISAGRQLGGITVILENGMVVEVRPIYVHRRQR